MMMMTGSVVITLPLFFMFRGFPPSPKPLHKHLLLVIYTCTRWQATPTYIACTRLPVTYRLESKIEELKQKQNCSCVFFRLKVRFWQDGWVGNITFDINFEPQTFSHYHLLDICTLQKVQHWHQMEMQQQKLVKMMGCWAKIVENCMLVQRVSLTSGKSTCTLTSDSSFLA